jgi:hypothetical protein
VRAIPGARDQLMTVVYQEWQAARAWLLKELRGERRHDT